MDRILLFHVVGDRIADDLVLDETIRGWRAAEVLEKVTDVRRKKGKCSPSDPTPYRRLGKLQVRLGLYKEAIESYEQAIARRPENTRFHYGLGSTQFNLGLFAEPIKSYKRAIELDPENAQYYYLLGLSQYDLGLDEEAINSFEKYLSLDVNNADGFVETAKNGVKRLKQQHEGLL